jgi:hypothetical protein
MTRKVGDWTNRQTPIGSVLATSRNPGAPIIRAETVFCNIACWPNTLSNSGSHTFSSLLKPCSSRDNRLQISGSTTCQVALSDASPRRHSCISSRVRFRTNISPIRPKFRWCLPFQLTLFKALLEMGSVQPVLLHLCTSFCNAWSFYIRTCFYALIFCKS